MAKKKITQETLLETDFELNETPVTAKTTIGVANTTVNIREKASTESNVVKVLEKGDKVTVLGEEKDFYVVENGFIMKEFLDKKEA